ncbi:hypothetical protein GS399_10700 [Pedobacter sp. HMF7647]|uniref:Glycine zipper family protein n=1 Tax=Hufsiella arboris TaxID=2695275 RepID=A0A7K1YBG2_9SPHI|nr:hypothetical protein [Hufsiella arboris]MXV51439.1 hypothetical protein [Hufsiella arboris]
MKKKITAVVLLACFFLQQTNFSYAGNKPKKYDAIVKTTAGLRYKGVLNKTDEHGIDLLIRKQRKHIDADSISTIRIRHSGGLQTAMLVGAGVGMAGGATAFAVGVNKDKIDKVTAPVFIVGGIVYGAAMGAFINLFGSVKRYKDVNHSFEKLHGDLDKYTYNEN